MKKLKVIIMIVVMALNLIGCDYFIISSSSISDYVHNQNFNVQSISIVNLLDTFYLPTSNVDNHEIVIKKGIYDQDRIPNQIESMQVGNTESSYSEQQQVEENKNNRFIDYYYAKKVKYPSNFYGEYYNYLNDEFKEDLNKLENNEISSSDIFDKYGTHVVITTVEAYYYQLKLEVSSKILDFEDIIFVHDYITNYEEAEVSHYDTDKYYSLYSRCDINLELKTSTESKDYLDVINTLHSSDLPLTSLINESNGYIPIWLALGANYNNISLKLESDYDKLFN